MLFHLLNYFTLLPIHKVNKKYKRKLNTDIQLNFHYLTMPPSKHNILDKTKNHPS